MRLLEIAKQRASLLVLAALALGVFAYEWHQLSAAGLVSTAKAKPHPEQAPRLLAEGRVVTYPGAEITVSAELTAKIAKLAVEEQDSVKAGDVLAELDVARERAAQSHAWARVKEVDADLAHFRRERERAERLFEENVVSQTVRDKSVHELERSKQARVSLLAAATEVATIVAKSKILAPIGGTVTARLVDSGEMVAAGAPLITIADLTKRRIEAEVGEFDAGRVRLGAKATIRAEGYDGMSWSGRVEEIPDRVVPRQMRPLDPARPVDTRVLLVKIQLDDPIELKLGQRVEVEIEHPH